ncbi:SAF domain-containing protein [Jiangella gansuensis]|uniref:SAF domain-containing protein n=1 Tax=Jiangella gansuensis TaxID=281473 RepID=UPI0004AF37B8|nr:SAF domain-containing protein [Jiangella gansuensis]
MAQTARADTTDHAFEPTFSGITHPERRYRRRPALIGLGVGLLAACGAGAAYLAQSLGDTMPVLALTETVHRGQVIETQHLTTARAAPDPALQPVAAAELDRVVGRRAATDLVGGTLLTAAAVTSAPIPSSGQSVVGVAVTEAQLPRFELNAGDRIRVFGTPNPGDRPSDDHTEGIPATVVGVSGLLDSGHVVVDVVVSDDVAGTLIAHVATGRVGIALDAPHTEEEP